MTARITILAAVTVVVLSGGCAHHDYVRDAPARVKAADWSKMETVEVVLKEFSYSPPALEFHAGLPYKLRMVNKGKKKHYFTAGRFFKAIASRKVQSNTDGEIKAPYFTAIEVLPGGTLDLYFIPVREGAYDLLCTIPGHADAGMTGTITIR